MDHVLIKLYTTHCKNYVYTIAIGVIFSLWLGERP